jgi:hypothetical protein
MFSIYTKAHYWPIPVYAEVSGGRQPPNVQDRLIAAIGWRVGETGTRSVPQSKGLTSATERAFARFPVVVARMLARILASAL